MPFIDPMLASGEPKKDWDPIGYWMEEKYDGHRLIVEVEQNKNVKAWGRYGIERKLPDKFKDLASYAEPGVYDGELIVPGQRSHNVVELTKQEDLIFVAFDILVSYGVSTFLFSWEERREILKDAVEKEDGPIRLSRPKKVEYADDILTEFERVVDSGGEGLILKNPEGLYLPGKRPRNNWIKKKTVRTAVMEIIGFSSGRNGPFSRVVLEGDDMRRTTVKVLTDALLVEVHKAPQKFIGRKLRIEYTERYPNGTYRHPRWDHLVEEDNDD